MVVSEGVKSENLCPGLKNKHIKVSRWTFYDCEIRIELFTFFVVAKEKCLYCIDWGRLTNTFQLLNDRRVGPDGALAGVE